MGHVPINIYIYIHENLEELEVSYFQTKPYLVGGIPTYPSEKYEFVKWDDSSQLNGKS